MAETFVANLAIQGLAALTGILLARLLGASGRGDFAAALVWPSILGGIAVFGTDVALARLAASGARRLRQLYTALVFAIVFVSVPAMLVGYFLLPILYPPEKHYLLQLSHLLLLAIPPSVASVLCANVALGMGAHRPFNSIRISFSILYVVGVAGVAVADASSVTAIAVCYLVAASVTAGYGLMFMRFQMISGDGPAVGMREIAFAAAPFGLVSVAQALISNLPVALLTFFVDSKHLGYFVVAMVASSAHSSLGSAIGRMLFAKVSVGGADTRIWFGEVFRQSILLYAILAIGLAVLLPHLVPIMFGEEFRYSGILATGLVVVTSLNALGSLLEETLRAKGLAGPILATQFAGAAVLVLWAGMFVAEQGIQAMIWACLFGAGIQLGLLARAVTRQLEIPAGELIRLTKGDAHALLARLRAALART